MILIREQYDLSEKILDININNDLIKDIIYLQFTKCLFNINDENYKSKKHNIVNNAYDDAFYICNKVLAKKRVNNNSIILSDKKNLKKINLNSFFESPFKKDFTEIYCEIILLLIKDYSNVSIDEKILKKIQIDSTNISVKDLEVNQNNCEEGLKFVKEFLQNYKNFIFANLIGDLQYEYCIFKAENTKMIKYQENIYPISFTKRIPTEEKIKNHFIKMDEMASDNTSYQNKYNGKECDMNDSFDSMDYMINKEVN